MKKLYLLALMTAFGVEAQISQVRDIFPGTSETTGGEVVQNNGNPTNFFVFGDVLLFRATDGIHGVELWRSNGTEQGTFMVRDINDNPNSGNGNSNPSGFVIMNNEVIFNATTGNQGIGQELWKTDGTNTGTVLIKDIRPGAQSSNPSNFTLINPNTLLFSANDGTLGVELWRTNGTEAGTVNVFDFPGTANSISWMENLNGTAVYGQILTGQGRELFISDGTEAGTSILLDINPGSGNGVGVGSFVHNNVLYFQGNSGTTGFELWKTDGTAAGTQLVKDINPGTTASSPSRFAGLGSSVYFRANSPNGQELWVTDGTESGTVEVADINVGEGNSDPNQIEAIDGKLFFFAADNGTDYDFYTYDGTTLTKLMDFNAAGNTVVTNYVLLDGLVYFAADSDGDGQRELWQTDGTMDGTVSVASTNEDFINPTGVNNITLVNGKIFFSASLNDGIELFVYEPMPLSNPSNELANIKVYPNPTRGEVFVSGISNDFQYQLFDSMGRLIQSGTAREKVQLNAPKGFYVFVVQNNGSVSTHKLMINN